MSVLHVTWLPRTAGYEGIVAKIGDLQAGARQAGIPLEAVVLSGDAASGVVHHLPALATRLPWSVRLGKSQLIRRFLDERQPASVILRYPGAIDLSLPRLLAEWGSRIITEHHTDEIAELGALPGGALRQSLELALGRKALGQVAGGIAVTGEIAELTHRRGLQRPIAVIGNGIATGRFPPWAPAPRAAATPLRLAMIAGVFWPWHGLDRLLTGILQQPASPLELHLIGQIRDPRNTELLAACAQRAAGRVVPHGSLKQPAVDALLGRMHGAISSLALHRNGMTQACPIKSREYASRGIPFVQAYQDPDLPPGTPGVIELPGDESPILPEQLLAQADRFLSPADSAALRAYARERLDYRRKAQEMVDFIRTTGLA